MRIRSEGASPSEAEAARRHLVDRDHLEQPAPRHVDERRVAAQQVALARRPPVGEALPVAVGEVGLGADDVEADLRPRQQPGGRFEVVLRVAVLQRDEQELALARKFILTAVARKDLDQAYNFTHPDLRGGLTRKEWDKGNIPVVYYEARNAKTAGFQVDYSYATQALLEVDLVAKAHTETRPELLFYLGLKREGGKKTGRWLVNYWEPHWRPPVPQAPN